MSSSPPVFNATFTITSGTTTVTGSTSGGSLVDPVQSPLGCGFSFPPAVARLQDVLYTATIHTPDGDFQDQGLASVNARIAGTLQSTNLTETFTSTTIGAAPVCQLTGTGTNVSGQKFIQITTQDATSGLASIQATESSNASVQVPTFSVGTLSPVVVTATKQDQTTGASVVLRVTNQAGQFTDCDPAIVTVGREAGNSPVQVIHHVAGTESKMTISNGRPGTDRLQLVVNGHTFKLADLRDGQTRRIDVSSAMRKGTDNTVLVVAHGPKNSSAVIIISDS